MYGHIRRSVVGILVTQDKTQMGLLVPTRLEADHLKPGLGNPEPSENGVISSRLIQPIMEELMGLGDDVELHRLGQIWDADMGGKIKYFAFEVPAIRGNTPPRGYKIVAIDPNTPPEVLPLPVREMLMRFADKDGYSEVSQRALKAEGFKRLDGFSYQRIDAVNLSPTAGKSRPAHNEDDDEQAEDESWEEDGE
jgi:hypothetical protein